MANDVERPVVGSGHGELDPKAARLVPDEEAKKFGWSFDGATTYELFTGFATAHQNTFAVLVDPRGPMETVYLDSSYLGGSS
ncbi:hypothetical protein [Kitasatospora sp. MAP5-34]|uniref:hypothetical protein n=1 Tax=Kitasatospora sp. MAP5-34 TaxID=3035102 RepID=UPI002474ED4B|nr:hypothetical protein [Kitasatospora sp. MAP5-34]MDH6578023.1 hypothetical protein [Kitasatospora sp. MAP5-34]